MVHTDRELALRALADIIRRCIGTLGPTFTARLLGTIALDLFEAGRPGHGPLTDRRPTADSSLVQDWDGEPHHPDANKRTHAKSGPRRRPAA